jgi:glycerol-3-phosphate dehydrogenase (NAD(P)+)
MTNSFKVGVMGGGSWGTTVAALMTRNADVKLWARSADTVSEINESHSNVAFLPGARLPETLVATHSIEEAVRYADLIVMGIPSHAYRVVLEEVARYVRRWVPVISLAKGLEQGTRLRMSQVSEEVLPGHPPGVLTGPNLAREIALGQAAASVIAVDDEVIVKQLQTVFNSGLFRVYTNTDVVGCELAGALKNVMAIAAGMGDGTGAGENTRSGVITRGLAELTRLGTAMGGKPETFAGLAGVGDLIATCTSTKSRNRFVGEKLGEGCSLDEIIDQMNQVAEGVKTCKVVMELAEEYDVAMPIATEVYRVVHEGQTPREAYRGLLRLPVASEAEPG